MPNEARLLRGQTSFLLASYILRVSMRNYCLCCLTLLTACSGATLPIKLVPGEDISRWEKGQPIVEKVGEKFRVTASYKEWTLDGYFFDFNIQNRGDRVVQIDFRSTHCIPALPAVDAAQSGLLKLADSSNSNINAKQIRNAVDPEELIRRYEQQLAAAKYRPAPIILLDTVANIADLFYSPRDANEKDEREKQQAEERERKEGEERYIAKLERTLEQLRINLLRKHSLKPGDSIQGRIACSLESVTKQGTTILLNLDDEQFHFVWKTEG